jgi:SAM-dependent methyltransferase
MVEGGTVCRTCGTAYGAFSDAPKPSASGQLSQHGVATALQTERSLPQRGYLDLLWREAFEHQTRYLDEEFEQEIDHEHVSLPLLAAKVRNDLLRQLLKPQPHEAALEVGCGNAKFCYWNRERFGVVVGVDAAPLFAEEALDQIPLVRGDVRGLPFAAESFDKVFSIDLLEHLSADGIAPFFAEINRVLKLGGQVFIFSNTREMGRLWPIIALEKKVSRFFSERGVFDFKRDELRKSDHIKALKTFDELEAALQTGGFQLEQKVFWNGVFQGLVDNIIIKAGEYLVRRRLQARTRKQNQQLTSQNSLLGTRLREGLTGLSESADGSVSTSPANAQVDLMVRKQLKRDLSQRRGGAFLLLLRFLSLLMKLDIWLFGRLRTGPYFILIKKVKAPPLLTSN